MLFLTLNKNIFTLGDRGTAGKNGDSGAVASHRASGFYKQSSRPHDQSRGFQQSSPFFCRQIGEDSSLTDSQEFQDFVRDRTQAEIIQAIGRLRGDNRPQEQLCFYFCADYDLSFLEMKVENINAADITISAASKDEKSWWKIQNAVKELWSQGRNITQASVESISGITQGYISKVVSKFSGNWKEWLKIFLSLLNTFNSKRNNSDNPSEQLRDEAHFIGCNLMPLLADYDDADLTREIFSWYRNLNNKYWQWILETTPVQVQGKIIIGLLSMLPKPWHQELMELCYR